MSYNYWKEIRKWERWKDAEEKQLRELGVSEDIIKRLHTYDWEVFKRERNYQIKLIPWTSSMEYRYAQMLELPFKDIESLLDSMENMELFHILAKEDYLTLQILFYKIMGYTNKEISQILGMKKYTIDKRFQRLKKIITFFILMSTFSLSHCYIVKGFFLNLFTGVCYTQIFRKLL